MMSFRSEVNWIAPAGVLLLAVIGLLLYYIFKLRDQLEKLGIQHASNQVVTVNDDGTEVVSTNQIIFDDEGWNWRL